MLTNARTSHARNPLTRSAAAHLRLPEGLPVAQGGADAFIGCIGLGVVHPGQMAMLTGSSHLHIGMSAAPLSGRGMFGSYKGAVLPGVHVVEGGQVRGVRGRPRCVCGCMCVLWSCVCHHGKTVSAGRMAHQP